MRTRDPRWFALIVAFLIVSAACTKGPLPQTLPDSASYPKALQQLDLGAALRAGYLAAGFEAAAYTLLAIAYKTSPEMQKEREKGYVLLSLADEEITTALSSILPPTQPIHLTAAWNAWRKTQAQMLLERLTALSSSNDSTSTLPDVVPREARKFGEYVQAVWPKARASIVATYLLNSTEALVELERALCSDFNSRDTARALVTSIGWQERLMAYLADTSIEHENFESRLEPGWAATPRTIGSVLASGIAAAGVWAASTAHSPRKLRDNFAGCEPDVSGQALFARAVAQIHSSITGVASTPSTSAYERSIEREIEGALAGLDDASFISSPEPKTSRLQALLADLASGDTYTTAEAAREFRAVAAERVQFE